MNTTEAHTYALKVPAGFLRARDLVSGKEMILSGEVKIPPLSTVVLYLGKQKPPGG